MYTTGKSSVNPSTLTHIYMCVSISFFTWTLRLIPASPSAAKQNFESSGYTRIIYAYGYSNSFAKHAKAGSIEINFVTGESYIPIDVFKVVHGSLMVLAMGILLPGGVLVARFTKLREPTTGPGAFWFLYHQVLQYSGLVVMLLGFGMAVYFQERDGNAHFRCMHCMLGLGVVISAVMQPVNAWMRPSKESKWRSLWEKLHKGSGWLVLLASVLTILFGLYAINAPNYFFMLYSPLPSLFIVIFVVNEYRLRDKRISYTLLLNDDLAFSRPPKTHRFS